VIAGILWLGLSIPPFVLAGISLLVGSQSSIVFAALAICGLVAASGLLLRPGGRSPLVASAALGVLLAALAGVAASRSEGVFPSPLPTLAYGLVAALVAVISARAAWLLRGWP
jgi:hypothetical protein